MVNNKVRGLVTNSSVTKYLQSCLIHKSDKTKLMQTAHVPSTNDIGVIFHYKKYNSTHKYLWKIQQCRDPPQNLPQYYRRLNQNLHPATHLILFATSISVMAFPSLEYCVSVKSSTLGSSRSRFSEDLGGWWCWWRLELPWLPHWKTDSGGRPRTRLEHSTELLYVSHYTSWKLNVHSSKERPRVTLLYQESLGSYSAPNDSSQQDSNFYSLSDVSHFPPSRQISPDVVSLSGSRESSRYPTCRTGLTSKTRKQDVYSFFSFLFLSCS